MQKVLAAAGFGSRRECETLITEGRVVVDRQVVTELGTRVHPRQQEISVDGTKLRNSQREYYLVNKPRGILSTNADPDGRPRVIDLISTSQRLFTVGRLDKSSEGLILVTNDGELANHLAHPRYGIEKLYQVEVAGHPTQETLNKIREGVHLAEGIAQAEAVHIKQKRKQSTLLEMVLSEGRNREIRRVLARFGHKVMMLRRVAIGPLRLGDLPVGAYRSLTPQEVQQLNNTTGAKGKVRIRQHRKKKVIRAARPGSTGGRQAEANTPRVRVTPSQGSVLGYDGQTGSPGKKSTSRPARKQASAHGKRSAGGERTASAGKSTGRSSAGKSASRTTAGGTGGAGKRAAKKSAGGGAGAGKRAGKRPGGGPAAAGKRSGKKSGGRKPKGK